MPLQVKTFSQEERLKLLRKILSGFNPITTTKKAMRLDWFHGRCNVCDFHHPMWFSEATEDYACPLCGSIFRTTQCSPNHPDLKLWWDVLDGGAAKDKEARREAIRIAEYKSRRKAAEKTQAQEGGLFT